MSYLDRSSLVRVGRTIFAESTNGLQEYINGLQPAVEKHNVRVQFDVTGHIPNTISIGEFCAAKKGVQLRICNPELRRECLIDAITDNNTDIDIMSQFRNQPNLNKYKLRKPLKTHDKVAILPGDSCFGETIDMDLLDKAVADGAFVKPHPVSTKALLKMLSERYGKKVLSARVGAYELVMAADTIYITGSSELSIYAFANDVKVERIDKENPLANYFDVFDVLMNSTDPYTDANRIFNSYKSGIIFPEYQNDKHVHKSVTYMKELIDDTNYNSV